MERRRHERVRVRAEVSLAQHGRTETMATRDVSVSGAFLETTLHDHMDLGTGCRCELTLVIDEDTPAHASEDGHTVHLHARIVRRDPGENGRSSGLAVVFEDVDLENLARLRALVSPLEER
jgi:hypothetical protein